MAFRDAVTADADCFSFVELYPEGFTPVFGAQMTDYSFVAGIRGGFANGLLYDVSGSIGENNMDGFLDNTLNPSLGPGSQRDFEIGEYTQTGNQRQCRPVLPGRCGHGLGPERRRRIRVARGRVRDIHGRAGLLGDRPYQQYGFGTGSNGFGGFNPASSGAWDRANVAAYLDLEVNATDN